MSVRPSLFWDSCFPSAKLTRAVVVAMVTPVLLVLLRGEVFRSHWQLPRDASADLNSQLEVLTGVQRNVLYPAAKLGWRVRCLAHLSYSARDGSIRKARSLLVALRRLQVDAVEMQPAARREATQLLSILRALQWSARTTAKLQIARVWGAMLLIRADLVIKHPLPLPPAATGAGCEVLAPFQMERNTPSDVCAAFPPHNRAALGRGLVRTHATVCLAGFGTFPDAATMNFVSR